MRSLLTDEIFDKIIDHFAHNADNIHIVLDKYDISKEQFYKVVDKDARKSERYMQARTLYVENRLMERDKLNAELLEKLQTCDPKIANALAAAYKEQIRQIEWDVAKLLPKKYGDSTNLNFNDNGLTINIKDSK